VGASRGVIFSTKGFQSGAITQAVHEHIDLFTVRDLTAEEWGLPGRVVDFYLQIIQPSIGNPALHNTSAYLPFGAVAKPMALNLSYGVDGPVSSTPILNPEESGILLETRMAEAAQKALAIFMTNAFTINGGTECTRFMLGKVNLEPKQPFVITVEKAIVNIPKIAFDLGIKITQSRITIDRAKNYMFALAVENCVNGNVSTASRPIKENLTTLAPVAPIDSVQRGDTMKNGSVMRVFLKGFFLFEEMAGLQPIPMESIQKHPPPTA
jgi:hypothetical protein